MFSEVINFVSGLFKIILDPIIYVTCSERYFFKSVSNSESNQGLSLGRIVTYLNGIQLLKKKQGIN